jgi:Asp-tRNA(Asn)/Glu-tRNA(Gln) amidotransferase A subunit family amidase
VAAAGSPAAPRIGHVRSYYQGHATEEVERHLDAIAERLRAAGATVLDAGLPGDAATIREAGEPIMKYEAAQAHEALYEAHGHSYRPGIKALVEGGRAVSTEEYVSARADLARLRGGMIETLNSFDVLLLPVAPATAPASIETTGQGIFCAPASFAGLPAISLPSGLATDGMPLAVQLMAAPLAEATLLRAAAWVESVLEFTAKPDIAP